MPRRLSGSRHIFISLVCLAAGLLSAWSAPPRSAAVDWSAIADQKVSYTTDAFQFSSARRLALSEDPSQPTVVPLDKPEDVIWEPAAELIGKTSNGLGLNEVSFKARGFIYTDKPIFNHGDFRVQDRQWLDPDTSVLLRYRYVPNLFLGPNFERQTGERLIQEERVTSHHWRAELDRRLSNHVHVTLITRYGLRLYNEAFSERDTKFYSIGPRLLYQPTDWMAFTLGYLYERGLADGRNEPQFLDDRSYHLHLVTFGTELRLTHRLALNLVYLHLRKAFTTDLIGDTARGRQDFTHQGFAELRYWLTSRAAATVGVQHTQRTSTNALRGFNDTIVSLGAEYRF